MVTGGAGFIGSALVRFLVGEVGCSVLNVDALTYAASLEAVAPVAERPGYRFVQADIRDAAAMTALLAEHRPVTVMHLAAESHVDRSIDGPAAFMETNIMGTYTLLETVRTYWSTLPPAERAAFRFHHVSTDEVFGSLGPEGMFTDDSPHRPNSPYAASKAASDHLARAWHRTYGLPVVITHSANTYGPYQFPEKLIPLIILNALEGRSLPVYGTGENRRDWLYVDDHARALWTVASRAAPGAVYAVGADQEYTNISLVQRICDLLDSLEPASSPRRQLITFVEDRPGHDGRYALDTGPLRRDLGWFPREDLESGLRKTITWYRENAPWWQAIRARRYAGDRLGLGQAP